MKKTINRILSIILCVIILFSSCPAIVNGEERGTNRGESGSISVSINGTDPYEDYYQVAPHSSITMEVDAYDAVGTIDYAWYRLKNNDNDWETLYDFGVGSSQCTVQDTDYTSIYRCEIIDSNGNTGSAWFHVEVQNNLTATANDSGGGQTIVCVRSGQGTELVVNADASDTTGLSYVWYKFRYIAASNSIEYDTELTVNDPVLSLSNITEREHYECAITDRYGNNAYTAFDVFIDNDLTVTANDSDTNEWNTIVRSGSDVVLEVHPSAVNEQELRYKWVQGERREDGNYYDFGSLPGDDGPSLTLTGVVNAELWACCVFDRYGNDTTAFFNVSIDNNLTVYANNSQDNNDSVFLAPGQGTILSVTVEADDTTDLSFRWVRWSYDPENDWYDNCTSLAEDSPVLTLDSVKERVRYECHVTDRFENGAYAYFDVFLDNDLTVTANDSENNSSYILLNPGQGTTLTVHVEANNTEGLSFKWSRSKYSVDGFFDFDTYLTDTEPVLVIDNVNEIVRYECRVTDKYGNTGFAYFDIYINNDLTVTANDEESNSADVYVVPGGETTLIVHATANDEQDMTYSWFVGSEYVEDAEVSQSLVLREINENKNVQCTVKDRYGNIQYAWFNVYVYNDLKVTVNDTEECSINTTLDYGSSFTMTVHATAADTSGISYWWEKRVYNSVEGYWEYELVENATSPELSLDSVTDYSEYICHVQDRYGNVELAFFNIGIQNDLRVYANDSLDNYANVSVVPGEGAVLSVTVEANDTDDLSFRWEKWSFNPEYNWYDDCTTLTEDGSVLMLNSVTERVRYECCVTDRFGNSAYAYFEIYPDNGLTVTANDSGSSDWSGVLTSSGDVVFEVHPSAYDEQGISYSWYEGVYRTDGEYWDFELVPGETSSSVVVSNVSKTVMWRCRVTDKYNNSVDAYFYVSIDNRLTVTANDEETNSATVYVAPGGKTTLTTHANANDITGLSYSWYINSVHVDAAVSETLELQDISEYTFVECRVTDSYGNTATAWFYIYADNNLEVTVNDTELSSMRVNLTYGSSFTMTVQVTATDTNDVSYRWERSYYNRTGGYWEYETVTGVTGPEIVLSSVTETVNYTCCATDKYGNSAYAHFYISIENNMTVTANDSNGSYATVRVDPQSETVLIVSVEANDTTDLSYKWVRYSYNSDNDYYEYDTDLPDIGSSITLNNISDRGHYECSVTDRYGNTAYAYFDVFVNNGLMVIANDSDGDYWEAALVSGSNATLEAHASAYDEQGISYTWYKGVYNSEWNYWNYELVSDEIGSRLTLNNVTKASEWYCSVKDKYGNEARAYYSVGIDNELTVTANDEDSSTAWIYVDLGGSVALTAHVSARDKEGLTYSWFVNDFGISNPAPEERLELNDIRAFNIVKCVVSDKFGNIKTAFFYVLPEGTELFNDDFVLDHTYAKLHSGSNEYIDEDTLWDDSFSLKDYFDVACNGSTITVTPRYSEEEFERITSGTYGQSNELLIVFRFLSFNDIYLYDQASSLHRLNNNFLAGPSGGGPEWCETRVGIGLWTDNDETIEYSIGNTVKQIRFVTYSEPKNGSGDDEPFDYTVEGFGDFDLTFKYVHIESVYENNEWAWIVPHDEQLRSFSGIPGMDQLFDVEFDSATCTIEITPLMNGQKAYSELGIGLDDFGFYIGLDHHMVGVDILSSFLVLENTNENFVGCESGGSVDGPGDTQGTNFFIWPWREVNETVSYTDDKGSSKSITIITHAAPEEEVFNGDSVLTYEYHRRDHEYQNALNNEILPDDGKALYECIKIEIDRENGIITVIPLCTKEEFDTKTDGVYGEDLAVAFGFDSFRGVSIASYLEEQIDNNNLLVGDWGDAPGWTYSEIGVLLWTENDETLTYRIEKTGEEKAIRFISYAEPLYEVVGSSEEPDFYTDDVVSNDEELTERIIDAIVNSDSFGIVDTIQQAAEDSIFVYDMLSDNLTMEEIESLETVEVQSFLDVKLIEVSKDEADVTMVVDITPMCKVVAVYEDGTQDEFEPEKVAVTEPVEMVFYVGDFLGSDVTVYVHHVKDDGTEYIYRGEIDQDGYLRFTNPNGFSSFEITTVTECSVTFMDEDGTTVLLPAAEYEYGTEWADVVKPEPTKAGYSLVGWDGAPGRGTGDITVTAKWELAVSYVMSNNITFEGALTFNAYTVLTDEVLADKDAYMLVTYTTAPTPDTAKEVTEKIFIKDAKTNTNNAGVVRRVFTVPFFIAQLNDEVTMKLYTSDGKEVPFGRIVDGAIVDMTSTGVVDTPWAYCDRIINNPNSRPAMVELAKMTKIYGTAAQLHFNYNTGSIPEGAEAALNKAIAGDSIATALTKYTEKTSGTKPTEISRYSKQIVFEADHALKYFLYLNGNADISKYTFMVEDLEKPGVFNKVEPVKVADGKYSIQRENIPSGYLSRNYRFRILQGDSIVYEITSSGLVYANAIVTKNSNPSMVTLVKAMYLYSQAAEANFGINQ